METLKPSLSDRIALGAILVAACTRALVNFAPLPVFDMDPAFDGSVLIGASAADSVLIDALGLAGAGWLLTRSRGGLGLAAALVSLACCAAIGMAIFHGVGDAEQLWRGATWVTGVLCAIALLASVPSDRSRLLSTVAVAVLGGVGVIIAMRGLTQMISEHPSMLAYYSETREQFLRAQGWAIDSPQTLAYERRLSQNEPTGWFGFSNVFATVSVATALLLGNIALVRSSLDSRPKGDTRARALLWGGAALCLGLVVASGSKGGIAAIVVGVVVTLVARRTRAPIGWLLVALSVAAVAGILTRGVIGVEWAERSLLFRWQYLVGALGTLGDSPWTGVGPAGFQTAFLAHRPIECVEEVQSAHGAFADALVAFGCTGAGLIALQLLLAWRAGRIETDAVETTLEQRSRSACVLSRWVVVVCGVISLAFEAPALDGIDACAWRLGALALGVLVAGTIARALAAGTERMVKGTAVGLAALAAVVVMHGEIDMAFWLPGSTMWGWVALAVAGSWALRRGEGTQVVGVRVTRGIEWTLSALAFMLSATLATVVHRGLAAQDLPAIAGALRIHEAAQTGSAVLLADARAGAAADLLEVSSRWPPRLAYAVRASEQWQAAADLAPSDPRAPEWLALAGRASSAAAISLPSRFAALLSESMAAIRSARIAGGSWQEAASAIERVLALNNRHTESWIRLADALERAGDAAGARVAIAMALESDATYQLDPLRQLSAQRRAELRSRFDPQE
ncbi:MAG: hypothetical protein EXS03_04215 [Phycisphaerales bacterium]|nr:hypothetical protein [Phycisphaerales bacterium]